MPIREYEAFVADWQEEDKANAYRNADLIAAVMNQNPYRKVPVTARELLGEDTVAPVGSEDALRGALAALGGKPKK
jgi:hypothetical protein